MPRQQVRKQLADVAALRASAMALCFQEQLLVRICNSAVEVEFLEPLPQNKAQCSPSPARQQNTKQATTQRVNAVWLLLSLAVVLQLDFPWSGKLRAILPCIGSRRFPRSQLSRMQMECSCSTGPGSPCHAILLLPLQHHATASSMVPAPCFHNAAECTAGGGAPHCNCACCCNF